MSKCSYCNADLKDNEPICEYCNMYNKHQMIENEKKLKDSIPANQEKENKKNKEQQNTSAIKCMLPASLVLTVGLFFFISGFIPKSAIDEGTAFMFGFFGIPIGIFCTIFGLINSVRELNVNPQNKIAKSSLAMIIFGVTSALLSDTAFFGMIVLALEGIVWSFVDNKK